MTENCLEYEVTFCHFQAKENKRNIGYNNPSPNQTFNPESHE